MSHAATDTNSNPIGATERTNLTVSSVQLNFPHRGANQALLLGQFSVDTESATGGEVVASIFVDGNLMMNTEVNNLQGNTGTLLSLSGVVTLAHGQHTFDLQAYIANMPFASIHHRSITVVGLE